ncbi:hypothetical protein [Aestuariivirga sp.]|uniref:hypothetical protein n=1 Tax=Aestuariivirga sp. TaxID=2650926 RepID=UPI0039E37743
MARRRHNKTGRGGNTLSSFIAIERYLLKSAAWRSLPMTARAAYIEMACLYDGGNNGLLIASARVMGERLGVNKATASRAIAELIERGFLALARQGGFNIKDRHAAEYRLTAYRCDKSGALASKEFLKWEAASSEHGCTSATVQLHPRNRGPKTTSLPSLQLHPCNREGHLEGADGCTSAPPLYSTMGGTADRVTPLTPKPAQKPAKRAPQGAVASGRPADGGNSIPSRLQTPFLARAVKR